MKNKGRYSTAGSSEGEYQPGSDDKVLKNLLNITLLSDLEILETNKLTELTKQLILSLQKAQRLTENDIKKIHKLWLQDIYSWAGNYRQVNVSKGGFTFAAAHLVPKLMKDFDKNGLVKFTPCVFEDKDEVIAALAAVHVELVLIHPFREGNGRLTRLISTLMALQAGLPILDFSSIKGDLQEEYFAAVRSGLDDYKPMEIIFSKILSQSQ